MNWYLDVLKKYATFSGRARRKEYWMFSLFNVIFASVCGFLDGLLGFISYETGLGILGSLYILATFLPSLAVLVRRLHDTDRSGWWVLIGIIPLIGAIVLLVFACLDSKVGENRFGPNPKELS
ncbi:MULTISPECIES: DUF805 domain-containing protein [Mannheimia]|uniref:DUF805 domain-containing protein n=1 Tax=Mannheimia pernigra TaxID=111844 RepID=A0A7H8UTZ7_9PAST|nr:MULTISPECIES: DUF805 domain-containing protein [Mannheimia]QLB40256.1 DUF805 domain-containing protein [Mannheimia pernigra]QLB42255.1 DUF805 domain-containing protein [Mannheimia pernigra]QLB44135.1 DUF805 domain-containing protein [Mannheimia pernigra]QTM00514.1 DUF805 domain-containing protein [Mannheimia sp. ZY171111]